MSVITVIELFSVNKVAKITPTVIIQYAVSILSNKNEAIIPIAALEILFIQLFAVYIFVSISLLVKLLKYFSINA